MDINDDIWRRHTEPRSPRERDHKPPTAAPPVVWHPCLSAGHAWRTIKTVTPRRGPVLEEWRQCERCSRVEVRTEWET